MRTTKAINAVVIYCRVSKDEQKRERSVGEQEAASRETADREGWHVEAVFPENDRSASRFATKGRPQYKAMVEYLRTKLPNALILWESSRGSREAIEWLILLSLCRTLDIKIHIIRDRRTYDLSISRDWKTLAEDGIDSAYESEKTRDRVLRGLDYNAENGKPHGRVLYGYARVYDEKRRFIEQIIVEDQASIVREAAERATNHESLWKIARDFNRRGITTPVSGPWDGTKIRNMITRASYVGKRIHRGRLVGDANWPAILDEKLWQACLNIFDDPMRKKWRETSIRYFLSGIPSCGAIIDGQQCNAVLRPKHSNKVPSYACSQGWHVTIARHHLDEYVNHQVAERLVSIKLTADDFSEEKRSDYLKQAKTIDGRIDELDAELAVSTGRAARSLSNAINQLDDQREELLKLANQYRLLPIVGKVISDPNSWHDMLVEQKREVLRSGKVVDSIDVLPIGRRTPVAVRRDMSNRVVIHWTETRLSSDPNS